MRNIRKNIITLSAAAAMILSMPFTALADGQRVLTLGVDLNDSQRNAIVSYCGANLNTDEIVWVNNQQERDLLSSWVPLEQIGSRTYSCAYVRPTLQGGIQVKTANLTWVTANMLASSLATSGIMNCEVIAVSPFPVSGTGALTGVLLAYENATQTKLDANKQQLAAQEMAATTQVAASIGQVQAAQLVNNIKIEIVNEKKENEEVDVQKIVDEAVEKAVEEQNAKNQQALEQQKEKSEQEKQAIAEELAKQTQITEDIKEQLVNMGNTMVQQEYDWSQMSETLESINESIKAEKEASSVEQQTAPPAENASQLPENSNALPEGNTEQEIQQAEQAPVVEALPEDSILINTNEGALDNAVETSTAQEAVENPPVEEQKQEVPDSSFAITIENTETFTMPEGQESPELQEMPEPQPGNEQETVTVPEEETIQTEQPVVVVPDIPDETEIIQDIQPEIQEPVEIPQDVEETPDVQETEALIQEPEAVVQEPEIPIQETEPAAPELQETSPETEILLEENTEAAVAETEAPVEETEAIFDKNLWNSDYPEEVSGLLEQSGQRYPEGDSFDKTRIVPIPLENKWVSFENGSIKDIYDCMTDENGNMTLTTGSLAAGTVEKLDGNGFYKLTLSDGTEKYYMLCGNESKYVFAETDEYGTFTGSIL